MRLIDVGELINNINDFAECVKAGSEFTRGYIAAHKDFAKLLAEHPTIEQPTWIPVTERLPDEDGKYLTYRIDEVRWGEFTSRMSCLSIEFYSVDFDGWWNDGVKLDDVTHWMPLPLPPKEEE